MVSPKKVCKCRSASQNVVKHGNSIAIPSKVTKNVINYQNSQVVKANAKPSSNDGIADSVAAKHTALDGSLDVLSPMIVL